MVVFCYPKDFNSHEVHAEDMGGGLTLLRVTDIEGGKHVFKVTTEGYEKWKGGCLLQRAFPELSTEERELIISGMSDKHWSEMFGNEV